MKSFIGMLSSIILYVVILPKLKSHFVVTNIDSDIITEYYNQVKNHIGKTGQLRNETLKTFCHTLRKSGSFEIASNLNGTGNIQVFPCKKYNISQEKLKVEIEQFNSNLDLPILNLHPDKQKRIQKLPGFMCYDVDGENKLFITPAYMPDSAFLFTNKAIFEYTSLKQILASNGVPVQLTAIIDEPYLMKQMVLNPRNITPEFQTYLENVYNSTRPSNSNVDQKDRLCDLKPIMKYRLCAIALRHPQGFIQHPEEYESEWAYAETSIIYEKFSPNIYYTLDNSNENCPNITSIFFTRLLRFDGLPHNLLRCSFLTNKYASQRKIQKFFYLSQHPSKPEIIFMFENIERGPWIFELEIPLLRNLPRYTKFFYEKIN